MQKLAQEGTSGETLANHVLHSRLKKERKKEDQVILTVFVRRKHTRVGGIGGSVGNEEERGNITRKATGR